MLLEQQREERVLREAAQMYASNVVCWPAKITTNGCRPIWGLEISNSSAVSVYGVTIKRAENFVGKNKTRIDPINARAAILAPGRYYWVPGKYIDALLPNDVTSPIVGNKDYMASIQFTDGNGRQWVRDVSGELKEVQPEESITPSRRHPGGSIAAAGSRLVADLRPGKTSSDP